MEEAASQVSSTVRSAQNLEYCDPKFRGKLIPLVAFSDHNSCPYCLLLSSVLPTKGSGAHTLVSGGHCLA